MNGDPRPIAGDPSSSQVVAMLDIDNVEWWLTNGGDYMTAAVETMARDGSDWQRVIALEWPTRLNHGTEEKVIRLMISPEDAVGLAETLLHTANWLMAAEIKDGE